MGAAMRTDLWTEEEAKFLADNYGHMTLMEMSASLNRTFNSVKTKVHRMGLSSGKIKKWTREELNFLEQNAHKMMAKDIAVHLGRSTGSVLGKGTHCGIVFTSYRIHYSDEDVALCRALHKEGLPLKEIAEKMEVNISTLRSSLYQSHNGYRSHVKPAQ